MNQTALNITNIQVKTASDAGGLIALASFDYGIFRMRGLRVVKQDKHLFISWPARRDQTKGFTEPGKKAPYIDLYHTLGPEAKAELKRLVLDAYHRMPQASAPAGEAA